jgi:hypothetical protein
VVGNSLATRGGRDLEKPYGPSALLAPDNSGTVIMEEAQILFRNFSGREGMYNREGDRNFCVLLDPEIAEAMQEDGWNIKKLKDRPDGTPGDFYLQVSVGFKGRPPRLVLINSQGRVELGEHECDLLDWVDIGKADLIIRPYNWKIREGTAMEATGIKAYCKTLFIHMHEDFFELKYADVPLADGGTEALEIDQSSGEIEPNDEGVYDITSKED